MKGGAVIKTTTFGRRKLGMQCDMEWAVGSEHACILFPVLDSTPKIELDQKKRKVEKE